MIIIINATFFSLFAADSLYRDGQLDLATLLLNERFVCLFNVTQFLSSFCWIVSLSP